MSVTVIIPARNEHDRLPATIDSILTQSLRPSEVIVVDDWSSDSTGVVSALRPVTSIRPSEPCGSKAKAQNAALPYVKTKYVVAIDADTGLDKHALKNLVTAMESSNLIGACSWVVPWNRNSIWSRGRTVEYMFAFAWFKRIQHVLGRPLIVSGCLNIFKTKTLRWLGGYPESTLAEDMDLTATIYERRLGKNAFVKDAVAYTDDPNTFKDMRNQLERWSTAYFQNVRKHFRSLWSHDKKAAFLLSVGLVDGMIGSLFYPTILMVAIFWGWFSALSFLLADMLTILLVAMYGARRFGLSLQIVKYMPSFWVVRVVNTYYYLKWGILTGLLGRSVGKYIKGH